MRLSSCIHVAYTCKHVNEYLQVINAPDLFVQELVTVTVESMKICTPKSWQATFGRTGCSGI
jgi:hypothetical protein